MRKGANEGKKGACQRCNNVESFLSLSLSLLCLCYCKFVKVSGSFHVVEIFIFFPKSMTKRNGANEIVFLFWRERDSLKAVIQFESRV